MVLQAFVDESFSNEEFILGGHIATAESWALLSKEWEQLFLKGIPAVIYADSQVVAGLLGFQCLRIVGTIGIVAQTPQAI